MKFRKGTMSLAVSIPGCIIIIIISAALIISALPTRKTLICTKSETVDGVTTDTKLAAYFSKEDELKNILMYYDIKSETEIPDSDIETIKTEYENSAFIDSIEVKRVDEKSISAELDLSDSYYSLFGTKFQEVRSYVIENYEMSCNES